MRVAITISGLGPGGAERVVSTLASAWAERGWHVALITLAAADSDFYPLHPRIDRIALRLLRPSNGLAGALTSNIRRLLSLRRAIRAVRPNVVISFVDKMNILTLLCSLGTGAKVIVSERVDPAAYDIGPIWSLFRRATYPFAAAVVAQTERVAQWLRDKIPGGSVTVIPNPVPRLAAPRSNLLRNGPFQTVVAVGRLTHQKGFDILLRAFARVVPDFPGWRLTIFGDGDERGHLLRLTEDLGIAPKVSLAGIANEIPKVLAEADVFVMSSRFEGFPNVLLEAMSLGLPVISSDCPSGPREIIHHDADGLLVPVEDVDALAQALRDLMGNPDRRARLAARAPDVLNRFSLERILDSWESLIERAIES